MALSNTASELAEKKLMDQDNQYVMDIEALNATIAQSVCDREVTDKVLLDREEQIETLTASISTAMEIDTEDVE
eukprot:15474825-Heterocapsa_arctica.AAC.1